VYRQTKAEIFRGDRKIKDDKLLAIVTNVNTIAGTVDLRLDGDVSSSLVNVPVICQSIAGVSIGDKIAVANFSGTWLALATVPVARKSNVDFYGVEVHKDLVVHGDLIVYGDTTTYGCTYHHGGEWSP